MKTIASIIQNERNLFVLIEVSFKGYIFYGYTDGVRAPLNIVGDFQLMIFHNFVPWKR